MLNNAREKKPRFRGKNNESNRKNFILIFEIHAGWGRAAHSSWSGAKAINIKSRNLYIVECSARTCLLTNLLLPLPARDWSDILLLSRCHVLSRLVSREWSRVVYELWVMDIGPGEPRRGSSDANATDLSKIINNSILSLITKVMISFPSSASVI